MQHSSILVPAASCDSPARAHHISTAVAPETPWMLAKHPPLTEEQSPHTELWQQLLTPPSSSSAAPHTLSLLPMEHGTGRTHSPCPSLSCWQG